jgi:hypothetical protein
MAAGNVISMRTGYGVRVHSNRNQKGVSEILRMIWNDEMSVIFSFAVEYAIR